MSDRQMKKVIFYITVNTSDTIAMSTQENYDTTAEIVNLKGTVSCIHGNIASPEMILHKTLWKNATQLIYEHA